MNRKFFALVGILVTGVIPSCGDSRSPKLADETSARELRMAELLKKLGDPTDWSEAASGTRYTVQIQDEIARTRDRKYFTSLFEFDIENATDGVTITGYDFYTYYRLKAEKSQVAAMLKEDAAKGFGRFLVVFKVSSFRRVGLKARVDSEDPESPQVYLERSDDAIVDGDLVAIEPLE